MDLNIYEITLTVEHPTYVCLSFQLKAKSLINFFCFFSFILIVLRSYDIDQNVMFDVQISCYCVVTPDRVHIHH